MSDYARPAALLAVVFVTVVTISAAGVLPAQAVDEYADRPTERFYVGETFNITEDIDADSTYFITKNGTDFNGEVQSDDGEIFVDTLLGEFPDSPDVVGDYELINQSNDGSVVKEWSVIEQSLALDANRTTINRNLNDNRNVELDIQSNRISFNAYVKSADLKQDRLFDVFDKSSSPEYDVTKVTLDGEDIVRVDNLNARDDIVLNFTNRETGDYNFQVESINASPPDRAIGQASIDFAVEFGAGGSASFQSPTFTTAEGDRVNIPLTLTNTDTAVIVIDNDRYNYRFRVRDNSGDGTVTVRMNTFTAGNQNLRKAENVFKATGDDSVTGVDGALAKEPDIGIQHIDTGQYTLRAEVSQTETDIATLGIVERATRGMTLYTMPSSTDPTRDNINDDATRLPELTRYQNQDRTTEQTVQQDATPQDQIANKDKLVVGINATGIFSQVSQSDEPEAVPASGFNVRGGVLKKTHGISVNITEVERDQNNELRRPLIGTAENVIVAPENDLLYFVLDTSEESTQLEPGNDYDIAFELDSSKYAYINEGNTNHGQNVTRTVSVVERTIQPQVETVPSREADLENVYGLSATNITLTGQTKIAPSTRAEIRVRSSEESPFLRRQTARVEPDGTISADFDLSGFEAGRNMSIQYAPMTSRLPARIVEPNAPPDITSTTVPSPVTIDEAARFNAQVEDESDVRYQWDFDDGATSELKNPVHAFQQAGSFNVSLTVSDEQGLTDSVTNTVVVEQVPNTDPVVRAIIGPATTEVNTSVNFGVSASDAETRSLNYDWEFGDGTTATGISVTHQYNSTGVYTVTATVGDNDGSVASSTATIRVEEAESTEQVEPAPVEPEPPTNQTPPQQNQSQQTPDQPGFGLVGMLLSVVGAGTVVYKRRT